MPSIYSSTVKNWQARLDYTITQSITANKSTISCNLYVKNTGGNYNNDPHSAYCRFMRGTSYDSGIMYRTYSWPDAAWHFVASYSFVVPHNADGTKTIEITGYWCSDNETQWTPYALDARGTITLPTIPRVSSLSFGQFTLGRAGRIAIRREAGGFRETLTYRFGEASGTIADKTGAGYVDWTPPISLAKQIPNAPSGAGEIVLTTYNGSTAIGSKRYPFTATVPADAAPSIKATLLDAGRGVELVGAYVQHQSRLRVQLAGTGKYGASIKSYSASVGDTQASAQPATFDLPVSGQIKVTYSCTDSRGKSASGSQTITVLPWAAPGVTSITAVRCTAKGVEDPVGDHAKVIFSAKISPLGNKNTASYQVKYRKAGSGAAWSSVAVPGAEGQYSPAGVSIIIPAPTSDGLDICVSAKDIYKQTDSLIVTMSSAQAFFRTNAAMTGITWGEEEVSDDTFRIGGVMRFRASAAEVENLKVQKLSAKNVRDFVVDQGVSGIWRYRKWASGLAECWGNKFFPTVNVAERWGNLFTSADIGRLPFPTGLFVEAPRGYDNVYNGVGDGMFIGQGKPPTATVSASVLLLRPSDNLMREVTLVSYAEGRWKR